jgi:hypothetical protein
VPACADHPERDSMARVDAIVLGAGISEKCRSEQSPQDTLYSITSSASNCIEL